jgi:8-oxo-dGTP diphosphatase
MVEVVAGIIERDGRILICQRRRGDRLEFKWEFPGGKIEPGEDPAAALVRELREELSIESAVAGEITRYEFRYPGKAPILLIFLRVAHFTGEPVNNIFESIAWEDPGRLPEYDFLEGDIEFVRRLAAESA